MPHPHPSQREGLLREVHAAEEGLEAEVGTRRRASNQTTQGGHQVFRIDRVLQRGALFLPHRVAEARVPAMRPNGKSNCGRGVRILKDG